MRKASFLVLAAAVVALLAVAGGSAATGDDSVGTVTSSSRFAVIDSSLLDSRGAPTKFTPASLSTKQVAAVVQLSGAPVTVRDADAKKSGQKLSASDKAAIRAQLKAQQDSLTGSLQQAGAQIVGQMQDAINGIQVTVAQKDLTQIASLPGVVAIRPVATYKPANVNGVPFIGAVQAWGSGFTGKGVKVGIIDTGIDYTHADFGGSGNPADYQAALKSDTLPASPAWFGPTAPKVKGGFDFVGDAYNADDPKNDVPRPDPNPLDCNSHGTHTAGTLAGFGETADGKTYTGPYNGSTVTARDPSGVWKIGPGVAPQADLYVYRVFGCTGSSNVVGLAINQAAKDGVDVISMSLGAPFGTQNDADAIASQNAVNDGIAVVAAAGNNGPGAYVVSSPGAANGALSVAALDGTVPTEPGAHLALSTGKADDLQNSNGATLPSGTFKVKVLRNADGSVSLGCDPNEYKGTAGMVVVTVRGNCARVDRAIYGQQAGSAAVVMINNATGFPPYEGPITQNPDTGAPVSVTIPFLGATPAQQADLVAADGGTTTMTPTTVPNATYTTTTSFSSGGPRFGDSAEKPEVIAPGLSVVSAGMGTGTGTLNDSGTSMATPMTAGTAALVKQAHPDWNGKQIKAAIMNTAAASLNAGFNPRLSGTGAVQAQKATATSVLATTDDQLDSLSFGYVPASGAFSKTLSFTLTNYGSSAATYNLAQTRTSLFLGLASLSFPSSVTVPAGGSQTVSVTLSMTAGAVAALPSDDTAVAGVGGVNTARGLLVATPASGNAPSLTLPIMLVPRGLSNVTAGTSGPWANQTPGAVPPGRTFSSSVQLSNSGIHSGNADVYAWGIGDAKDQANGEAVDVRDAGVQQFAMDNGDRQLVFLVNTWNTTSTQATNEYDVNIDTNGDGQPDFTVAGIDLGALTTGSFSGQYVAITVNDATGAIVGPILGAEAPMNGSTIELPTTASQLGITQRNNGVGSGAQKKSQFTYEVNGFNLVDGAVDSTSTASPWSPFQPTVSSGDFIGLNPGASAALALTVDANQQSKTPVLGWLVATVDDASGAAQADEIAAPTSF